MIVPRAFVDQKQIEALVKEAEAQLSPEVVRIRYSFGEDWSGDPAVYFRVILSDQAAVRTNLLPTSKKVKATIRDLVKPAELGVLDYFNFRSESEQAAMKEAAWA